MRKNRGGFGVGVRMAVLKKEVLKSLRFTSFLGRLQYWRRKLWNLW